MTVMDALVGLAAAALTLGVAALLPRPNTRLLLGILLGLVAGVYVGGALAKGGREELLIHGTVALAFVAATLIAFQGRPVVLGIVWWLHAFWDLLLHGGYVATSVAGWYPPACLAYDAVIGGALVYWGTKR